MNNILTRLKQAKDNISNPSQIVKSILFPEDVQKILNNAESKNSTVVSSTNDNFISSCESTENSLLQRTKIRFLNEQVQKQLNLEQIFKKTETIVMDNVKSSTDNDKPLEKDWLTYYSENACKISDEQMQSFWAKLLSGEILNPGTFSKRTIDALLKLSSKEANLFKKICEYVLETRGGNFLINDQYFENISDLSYSNIMRLDECGLLVASGMNRMKLQADKNQDIPIISNNIFIKGSVSEKISVEWQAFPLTTTGIELMKITFNETPKYYLKTLIEYLKKKYPSINWSVHKITGRDKENFYYDEEDITTSIKTSNFETP